MLIFLDVETTGLNLDDKICSIGLISLQDEKKVSLYELVNDGKKISSEASSVNHITNEMLKGKPKLKETSVYKFLQEHNKETTTLIAHNIKFELEKLSASGIQWRGTLIDTLRVTKHLIPECEHFSLQFLRYELKLYMDEEAEAIVCNIKDELRAHSAISDALFVKLLYDYLLEISTKEMMMELSFKNVLMPKIEFGKYSGKYIEEIMMIDAGYLHWMLANIIDLDEDLRYSINYYLQGQS